MFSSFFFFFSKFTGKGKEGINSFSKTTYIVCAEKPMNLQKVQFGFFVIFEILDTSVEFFMAEVQMKTYYKILPKSA